MFIPLFLLFSIGCGVAYTILVVNQDKHDESYTGTIVKTEVSKLTCEKFGNQKFWHNVVILKQDQTGNHIPIVLNKWGYFVTDGQSVSFNDETFAVGDRVTLFTVPFDDVYQQAKGYKILTDETAQEQVEPAKQAALHSTVPQASMSEVLTGFPQKPLPTAEDAGVNLTLEPADIPADETEEATDHAYVPIQANTRADDPIDPSLPKTQSDTRSSQDEALPEDLTENYTLFVTRQVGDECQFWTQAGDGRDTYLPHGTVSLDASVEAQLVNVIDTLRFETFTKIGEIDEKGGARVRYTQCESAIYKRPGGDSMGWITLPKDLEVEEQKRDGEWVQVQYTEMDTNSFPNQEMLSVKGWVHQYVLTDSRKRSFYHGVVTDTLDDGKWIPISRYYAMRGKSNEWFRTAKNALRYDFEKQTIQ